MKRLNRDQLPAPIDHALANGVPRGKRVIDRLSDGEIVYVMLA